MDLSLTPDEKELYVKLRELVTKATTLRFSHEIDGIEQACKLEQSAIPNAVELHEMLEGRGVPPKFQRILIKRKGTPGTEKFYNHPDSLKALIAFIDMPDLAGDPTDLTMGKEFQLKVYSNRSGRELTFTLTRVETGWDCRPLLYNELDNESIQYPHNLADRLEYLWQRAQQGKSPKEIQRAFNDLGRWMSDNEIRTPSDGAWDGYS